ncbi:HET-domain-containing protein [Phaeosphaeriaceae sp. SRC1lsM3a]|nr:HET-domain-containing protein [Stagonospora sp. SRC1lsM3a]
MSLRKRRRLPDRHNVRILELTRTPQNDTSFCGHLIITSLDERPKYSALSYVWGERSSNDPTLLVDGYPLQIRASLWQAFQELTTHINPVRLWVDQICTDQNNEIEKEQQVQLMSRIYEQAQRVIGWLGDHDDDSQLAFDMLFVVGYVWSVHEAQAKSKWRRAVDGLMKDGHLHKLEDLCDPSKRTVQAAARLVQRPWFYRLWIVQEVALASTLELRCGNSCIPGDIFFNAVRILRSAVSDPPMPWLQKPYRNTHKLGQLRAQIQLGQNHSFPHLAQTLSGWFCEKKEDRLNALFGLIFRNKQAWFRPSYSMSAVELYFAFAQAHIRLKGTLDILHFAGCVDNSAHALLRDEDRVVLQLHPPPDDSPSWVPDWRVQSRPLVLTNGLEDESVGFSATASAPDFEFHDNILRVCAREMDKIKVCGWPYVESIGSRMEMREYETFNHWFNLAKTVMNDKNVEPMFASTLVMDGKVAVTERQETGTNSPHVPSLFEHWAAKNFEDFGSTCQKDWKDVVDDSTRYGYIAEELCRDRTFFITEAGRFGLGSVHASPGDSIYLIHGLKTPFVIHAAQGSHILRGECYVYGLMDGGVRRSCEDSFLHLN